MNLSIGEQRQIGRQETLAKDFAIFPAQSGRGDVKFMLSTLAM